MILEGLINEKPDELLIVYSHVHLKDYYNEFKKRIKDFNFNWNSLSFNDSTGI